MERIAVYTIEAGPAQLEEAFRRGKVPPDLYDPFQSLVQRITGAAAEAPMAVSVSSEERSSHTRDFFAYALARVLLQHLPSTLLVDCDFHDTGLHGVVPQRDALGFLDLLLYGSSLGVITQETTGAVRVIGAGSFPVTKRMPFVMGAFEDAARRLLTHSRCVIFVGPARDDEGGVHPIIPAVDIPVLVRDTESSRSAIDPIEEEVAARLDTELLSVRVRAGAVATETAGAYAPAEEEILPAPGAPRPPAPGGREEPAAAAPAREAREAPEPREPVLPPVPPPLEEPVFEELPEDGEPATTVSAGSDTEFERLEDLPPVVPGKQETAPDTEVPVEVDSEPIPLDEPRYAAMVPRIVVTILGVLIIAFIAWWIWAGRPGAPLELLGGGADTESLPVAVVDTPAVETPPAVVDTAGAGATAGEAATVAEEPAGEPPQGAAESAGEVAEAPGTGAGQGEPATTPHADAAETGGGTGGTVLIGSDDILVMDDLTREWAGWYVIHISSFRTSAKAREDVDYLELHEFPVFIVFLDLGAKGKWYRVYAGPFRTREEASEVKKNLDDLSRVRFTRISKVGR